MNVIGKEKILPFIADAKFICERAIAKRAAGDMLDCLDLFRLALEREPDNLHLQMELAETYAQMGCFNESSRLLRRVMAASNHPVESLYKLGVNLTKTDQHKAALDAFKMYIRHPKSSSRLTGKSKMHIHLLEALSNQADDRGKRRKALEIKRTQRLFDAGRYEAALEKYQDAVRAWPEAGWARVQAAWCLHKLGRTEEAEAHVLALAVFPNLLIGEICSLAKLCDEQQERALLSELLSAARMLAERSEEHKLIIKTLLEVRQYTTALQLCLQTLERTPYDAQLLHMYAIALLNTGGGEAEAMRCWARIRRMYPTDSVAGYYQRATQDGKIKLPVEYSVQVPESEAMLRLRYLLGLTFLSRAALKELWDSNPLASTVLAWGLSAPESDVQRAVLMIVANIRESEAEWLLYDMLSNDAVSDGLKKQALLVLAKLGCMDRFCMIRLGRLKFTDSKEVLSDKFAAKVIRILRRRMAKTFDGLPDAILWTFEQCKLACGKRISKTRPENWAAALYVLMQSWEGKRISVEHTARMFGVRKRRMLLCARYLDQAQTENGDEGEKQ